MTNTEMSCRFSSKPEQYSLPYSTRNCVYEEAELSDGGEDVAKVSASENKLMEVEVSQMREEKRPQDLWVQETASGVQPVLFHLAPHVALPLAAVLGQQPSSPHTSSSATTAVPVASGAAVLLSTPQPPLRSSEGMPESPVAYCLQQSCAPAASLLSLHAGFTSPPADGGSCSNGDSRDCNGKSAAAPSLFHRRRSPLHRSFFGPTPDYNGHSPGRLGGGNGAALRASQGGIVHSRKVRFAPGACTSRSCSPKPSCNRCSNSAVTLPLASAEQVIGEEPILKNRAQELHKMPPSSS
eukprot:CAMPEP_0172740462 /NCGR_PEP_ID=MMETSP1074-20121228/124917_1 /TAXON_ID=2916 /ORGANISM="Ceratium fusus, Strain PA161109" /LENGTH=295 /DNA_ID=CAMNT_0013570579 /DNA_START=183 /DNA_END=1070 /DNA_ORIENTATION=-